MILDVSVATALAEKENETLKRKIKTLERQHVSQASAPQAKKRAAISERGKDQRK
jgi:uncharacterized protein with PIN domain